VVLAITRAGEDILLPTGHVTLHPGDVLAVAGTRDAVQAARTVLRAGHGVS
jgi:K+/H+ antiporter YhaU regulatory subunit KhtT